MMRASNFGDAPSKAIKLAIDYYNKSKEISQPYINFYIEDDKWEKGKAIPLYNKLRAEHNIDILFISNTGGTEALQEKIMTDNVILINPLHSNELLSSLNHNTFKIAKQTEEAYGLVGNKIVELGFNKVYIIHVADDLMTRGAMAVEKIFNAAGVEYQTTKVEKKDKKFIQHLQQSKNENYDAYIFFGYHAFGHAMKQAREMESNRSRRTTC